MLPLLLLATACSDEARVTAGGPASTRSPDQRYEADATVLESADHGPQLCLGGVMESYPPQCGGPDIVGWDWAAVAEKESASGTTWGTYHVVGTLADGTFTLTEPARPPREVGAAGPSAVDFTAPCPPPDGGWAVVDPATTTMAAQEAAMADAAASPDFAGSWVDQSINPALADGVDPEDEMAANDPTRLVLVALFTGDLERHEQELRARWGGALCVAGAARSDAELAAIQEEVSEVEGFVWSSRNTVANNVELGVIVDDGIQAAMDERYGEGVVVVVPELHPVP
jgi:hypothetical protein